MLVFHHSSVQKVPLFCPYVHRGQLDVANYATAKETTFPNKPLLIGSNGMFTETCLARNKQMGFYFRLFSTE